jgi:hypothetical protein
VLRLDGVPRWLSEGVRIGRRGSKSGCDCAWNPTNDFLGRNVSKIGQFVMRMVQIKSGSDEKNLSDHTRQK